MLRIKEIMEELKKEYFDEKEVMCGIYYMNGNDGTSFDWECNGRLCEFYVFKPDGKGLIKLLVDDCGLATVYIYDYEDPYNIDLVKEEFYEDITNAYTLYHHMLKNYDEEDIYDEEITEWVGV